MEIILLERIESLGKIGDIVKVKDGYARNYLFPMKKALRATERNKKYFETQRKVIEEKNSVAKTEAERLAKKISTAKIVLLRQAGEGGQLFGSVSARDIAMELGKFGYNVSREQVVLASPIKQTGLVEIMVRLHGEVSLKLSINVARTDEEAVGQEEAARKALELFESEAAAKAAERVLLGEQAGDQPASPSSPLSEISGETSFEKSPAAQETAARPSSTKAHTKSEKK